MRASFNLSQSNRKTYTSILLLFILAIICSSPLYASETITLSIDQEKIESELADFPVLLKLSDQSGVNDFNAILVVDQLMEGQQIYDDFTQFDGIFPNPHMWSTTSSSSNVHLALDKLKIISNPAYTYNSLRSKDFFQITGDFDVSIDFETIIGPDSHHWEAQFGIANKDGWYETIRKGFNNNYGGHSYYHISYDGSMYTRGYITRNDSIGKLRYVRIGSTIKTYVWYEDQWNLLGTNSNGITDGVYVFIALSASNGLSAEMNYDNFYVHSGIVDYLPTNDFYVETMNGDICFAEIEKWDVRNKEVLLWVRTPNINSSEPTELLLNYGPDAQFEIPAESINDTFDGVDGEAPRLDYWNTSGTIQSGKLKLRADVINRSQKATNNLLLGGDFDVQIDYQLVDGTAPTRVNAWETTFAAIETTPTYKEYRIRRGGNYYNQHYAAGYFTNNYYYNQKQVGGTNHRSGKFRFQRAGDVLKCYHWEDSDWLLFYTWNGVSTEPMQIRFFNYTSAKNPTVETLFDNFTANAGWPYGFVGKIGQISPSSAWDTFFKGVWHLTEQSIGVANELKDSTRNANHAQGGGQLPTLIPGLIGGAQAFDGIDDYIILPSSSTLNIGTQDVVLSVIGKIGQSQEEIGDNGVTAGIAGKGYLDETDGHGLYVYNDKVRYQARKGMTAPFAESDADQNDDEWRHYVGVLDRSSPDGVRLYVNGVLQSATGDGSALAGQVLDNTRSMGFGTVPFDSDFGLDFNGAIDEVRLSVGTVRSDAWIKASYHNAFDDLVTYIPPSTDTDGDGLIDYDEAIYGTDINITDTDGDGLLDGEEVHTYGTTATVADTDSDGSDDGAEVAYWSAAWNADADSDGLINLLDIDSDGDGQTDGTEISQGTDAGDATSATTVAANTENADFGVVVDEQQGGRGLLENGIRLINGNAVDSRLDIQFPSPNRDGLIFQAFYNSKVETTGGLGAGWRHTYEVELETGLDIGGEPVIRITDATGNAHYFKITGSRQYEGALDERSRLENVNNAWAWHRLDGSKYAFSFAGRLESIDDAVGNSITIDYDGEGRPMAVNDGASGRTIILSYNAAGRVQTLLGPVTDAVPGGNWITFGYDASNQNLTSVTYADGSGFDYAYTDPNDPTNLTEKRNKAGHLLSSWIYDTSDRCISTTRLDGKGVTVTYTSATQIDVTDAYSTLRTYTLSDVAGQTRVTAMQGPAAVPYADSNLVRWAYDLDLNLTEVEDARGRIDQYQSYDSRGNPGVIVLASGTPDARTINLTYHPEMNVLLSRSETSVLGGGNKVTTWDYDGDGDTVSNEDPGSLVSRMLESGFTRDLAGALVSYDTITTYTYDDKGQIQSIDGPKDGSADTTTISYDIETGNLLSVNQPIIGSATYGDYDAAGLVGEITDVNGKATQLAYDGRNRVTTITHVADGSSKTIVYNTAGLPETITDEDGIPRFYEYDAVSGYLNRIVDAAGNYIALSYDAQGNRIEMAKYTADAVRKSRKRWDYQHPVLPGQLYREIKYNDAYSEYSYDANGNPSSIRDFNGNTTAYTFDSFGRVETVTEPGTGGIATYAYDDHGNLLSVIDAEGHITSYFYDDMGRVLEVNSPDSGITQYRYDAAGNLVQKTDALGTTVTFDYDDLNRRIAENYPDPSEDVDYTYDVGTNGIGKLTGIVDASGTMDFGYDSRGRLVSKGSNISDVNYVVARALSPSGKLESLVYPNGRSVDFTRGVDGKITDATTTLSPKTSELFSGMTYNPFGSPAGFVNRAGDTIEAQSSDCGCLEVANPGSRMEQVYSYDDNGNVTGVTWTNLPAYSQTYQYDELNRLTDATNFVGTFEYTYDKVGNRLTRTVDTELETYTYYPNTNRLASTTVVDPVNFTQDAAGNTTDIGDMELIYNQKNRLIRVEESATVLGEYTYNALGQRVTKTIDGVTTVFIYDFDGNIIAESGSDGVLKREYIYVMGNRFAMINSANYYMYFYHNDHLGTPILITDVYGALVWEGNYAPFGDVQVSENSSIENNFRFAGQYFDTETGLHYNYHRYYDPKTGRYLTPDPIGLAGGINLYAYAYNNPVNLIDPFGLEGTLPEPPFSDEKLSPLDKDQLDELYNKHKSDPKERRKIREMQKRKGYRQSSLKKKKKKFKKRGVGFGLTTVQAYCTSDPEGCAELMKELGMNAPGSCPTER